MIPYPYSVIGYLFVGMLGALTFLFLMLMFDKDVAVLENDIIPKGWMVFIYVLLGGILAVIMSLPGSHDFSAGQLRIAFATGLGWPAIATGIGAGKQIGDLNLKKRMISETNIDTEAMIGKAKEEVSDYYRKRLERAEILIKTVIEKAEKEKEEISNYYKNIFAREGE